MLGAKYYYHKLFESVRLERYSSVIKKVKLALITERNGDLT